MQVPDPSDLQLKVVVMLMEATVARGASLVSQLRRSYVRIEHDEMGRKVCGSRVTPPPRRCKGTARATSRSTSSSTETLR